VDGIGVLGEGLVEQAGGRGVGGLYRRYESDPVISGLAVGGLGLVGLGLFSALFDDF